MAGLLLGALLFNFLFHLFHVIICFLPRFLMSPSRRFQVTVGILLHLQDGQGVSLHLLRCLIGNLYVRLCSMNTFSGFDDIGLLGLPNVCEVLSEILGNLHLRLCVLSVLDSCFPGLFLCSELHSCFLHSLLRLLQLLNRPLLRSS